MIKHLFLLFFVCCLLLLSFQSIAQSNKDADILTVTKRHLFFFKKTLNLNQSSLFFDHLKNQIKEIAYNSYVQRKTFLPNNKGNDISRSNCIKLILKNPIKVTLSSSKEETPISVNTIHLPFYQSNMNIPIVLNNEIPVFSKYEKFTDFINNINELLNKREKHGN